VWLDSFAPRKAVRRPFHASQSSRAPPQLVLLSTHRALQNSTTTASLPLPDHGDDCPASSEAFPRLIHRSRGAWLSSAAGHGLIFRRLRSVHPATNPLGNGPACCASFGVRKLCNRGVTNYLDGAQTASIAPALLIAWCRGRTRSNYRVI
jgi:hypothetical protein